MSKWRGFRGIKTILVFYKYVCTPELKKGETRIKVSHLSGDLEGSKTFDTDKRTFQTSSYTHALPIAKTKPLPLLFLENPDQSYRVNLGHILDDLLRI
jgi:hypothetical protein